MPSMDASVHALRLPFGQSPTEIQPEQCSLGDAAGAHSSCPRGVISFWALVSIIALPAI